MEQFHVSMLIWQMEQVKLGGNDKASQDPRIQMAQPTKVGLNKLKGLFQPEWLLTLYDGVSRDWCESLIPSP